MRVNFMRIMAIVFVVFSMSQAGASASSDKSFSVFGPKAIKKMLGSYPQVGSVEESDDFEELLRLQETRTDEECAQAALERKMSVKDFFASNNGPLSPREARRFSPRIIKAYLEVGVNILIAKRAFKRPRPYVSNSLIKPCIPLEKSTAYPSGHTTLARALAHVLAYKYPERAELFMQRADQVSFNRVLGGVHHPSDIVAGKKLGDALARKLLKSKLFLKELKAI